MQPSNTPGAAPPAYIEEVSGAPQTVGPIGDTIPGFIGSAGDAHVLEAVTVDSLTTFEQQFGINGSLYVHMRMFFANGGVQCKVMNIAGNAAYYEPALEGLQEITLVVVPEITSLPHERYQQIVRTLLAHCAKMQDRFAILDVYNGNQHTPEIIAQHREEAGTENLRYAASYFPFLDTTWGTWPPSSAVAGVYCRVDRNRGIWKAPANEALADVSAPSVAITDLEQQDLNVDVQTGKSINVIRQFPGKGTLIWGARTLAGNDNEWRYVSVQRFLTAMGHVIKKSFVRFGSEPNELSTWQRVQQMVSNYLVEQWRNGALAGSRAQEAFFVHIGLGVTMTQADIDNGVMILEIGAAVVRPAEFIILRFQQ
jgi:phage tail sheath protein FI